MKTLLVTLLKTVTRPTFRVPCALGLTLLALMLAPAAWAASPETLTGSGNWTVPTGVTSVTVEMWGGGGGGGAETSTTSTGCGSGGGGGGYSRATLTGLTGGVTQFAYSVGGAGSAGTTAGVAPNPGGNTTFTGVTTAGGGGAGTNAPLARVAALLAQVARLMAARGKLEPSLDKTMVLAAALAVGLALRGRMALWVAV